MDLLNEFKVVALKEKVEKCFITVSNRNVKFNRATARMLDLPEKVKFLTNGKQIAIIPTDAEDEDGIDFTFEDSEREKAIIIKEPHLMNKIREMVELEQDGANLTLKAQGTVYLDEKTVIFDLENATETVSKPRGRKKAE